MRGHITIFILGFVHINEAFLVKTNDPKQNLDYFIRALGSTDQTASSVNYINGSVFGKQPGKPLMKIFNYEGYNINRKILQSDGSYLSLSREIVVYRHPRTTVIEKVWMNPWTSMPNEVFTVANDPVNGKISADDVDPPRRVGRTLVNFNTDVVLEYPNVLTPDKYAKYSAGPVYDAVELYGFFANLTILELTQMPSVPSTSTWIRKSQYLPWMEMGTAPGCLYYTSFAWKCNSGLSCVADDIMQLVKNTYPNYLQAPTQDDEPNKTSWSVFKKAIDARRAAGQPDIIIPEVNDTSDLTDHPPFIDDRIISILNYWPLSMRINGTAYSEIVGKQPYTLFGFEGNLELDFEPRPRRDGYRLQFDGYIRFYNASTGNPLTFFNNPITGQTSIVQSAVIGIDYVAALDDMYSMDIPESQAMGLVIAFCSDHPDSNSKQIGGNWTVAFADLIFDYADLAKANGTGGFYGTAGLFSNWPAWMEMGDIGGNLVLKATLSKNGLF